MDEQDRARVPDHEKPHVPVRTRRQSAMGEIDLAYNAKRQREMDDPKWQERFRPGFTVHGEA